MNRKVSWNGVHAALDDYYQSEPGRWSLLERAETESHVNEFDALEAAAVQKVRRAFYAATRDFNLRDDVMEYLDVRDAVRVSLYKTKESSTPTFPRKGRGLLDADSD